MNLPPFELPVPDLGDWRRGNVGTEGVWRFEGNVTGPDVLITALVHGNELCGAWALLELLRQGVSIERGALTLAFCNLAAFDRFDPTHADASRFVEHDFNRVWGPALAQGSSSSIEHGRARELLPWVIRADCLLDLHSMHEPGPALVLTGRHARNIAWAQDLAADALVISAPQRDGLPMPSAAAHEHAHSH